MLSSILCASLIIVTCVAGSCSARSPRQGLTQAVTQSPDPSLSQSDLQAIEQASRLCKLPLGGHKSEHFLVMHPGQGPSTPAAISEALETHYKRFQQQWLDRGMQLQDPQQRLAWLCLDRRRDFEGYALAADGMDLWYLDGYYSAKTNVVALVQPLDEPEGFNLTNVTHEASHQLAFNFGLQKRGVMCPLWLGEGLATYFELDSAGVSGLDNASRRDLLLQCRRSGRLERLNEFVTVSRLPAGTGKTTLKLYAQAYGVFAFLLHERPLELQKYLQLLCRQRTGYRTQGQLLEEFTSCFGPMDELEADFNQFLDSLDQRQLAGMNTDDRK